MTPIGKPVVFGVVRGDEFRYLTGRGLDPETVQAALINTYRMKNLIAHPENMPVPDLGPRGRAVGGARPAPSFWITGNIDDAAAERFAAEVAAARGETLDVYVDSPGGNVFSALKMALALQRSKKRVTMTLVQADSAALLVTLGADHIVAARDLSALVHEMAIDPSDGARATAGALRDAAGDLDMTASNISALLGQKTAQGSTYWGMLMKQGRRLSAEALKNYGLVNEISGLPAAWLRGKRGRA